MKIKTERLEIRNFTSSDINDAFEIYMNEDVCRFLLHDVWTEANCEAEFQKKLVNTDFMTGKMSLACVLDGKVIGDISVMKADEMGTIEIGYAFNPQFSHKGYANEALKAVIGYLFKNYKIHRIYANMDARNLASKKLSERIGMRLEAHFLKDYWNKGEWTDSYIFAVLEEEWK